MENKELKQLLNDFNYYNSKGNSDRAKIILDRLNNLYPYDARVIFAEALYYDRLGPYNDKVIALSKLKELINMNAKNKETSMYEYIRIIAYMKIKSDEVNDYFNHLIKLDYKTHALYFYYGRYLEGQKYMTKLKICT